MCNLPGAAPRFQLAPHRLTKDGIRPDHICHDLPTTF
jgi:hypothetical protein